MTVIITKRRTFRTVTPRNDTVNICTAYLFALFRFLFRTIQRGLAPYNCMGFGISLQCSRLNCSHCKIISIQIARLVAQRERERAHSKLSDQLMPSTPAANSTTNVCCWYPTSLAIVRLCAHAHTQFRRAERGNMDPVAARCRSATFPHCSVCRTRARSMLTFAM